jgi:hypothetical protein
MVMQILGYLRRGGSRLALLPVVPALAMGAAFALAADAEPQYRAVATVVLTPPSGATGGVAVAQAVEGFQSALRTEAVIGETAEETGVPRGVISDSVTSRRLGTSAVVEVVYEGPERPEVEQLLKAQTVAATNLLFGGDIEAAKQQQEKAKARFDKATKSLEAIQDETGLILPSEAYRTKATEVSQLRVAVAQARSRGDSLAPLEEALQAAESELVELAAKVTRFDQPDYDLERARAELTTADLRLAETKGRLDASQSPAMLRVSSPTVQPRTVSVARQVLAAGVIGLFIAIAVIAVLELVRPRRRAAAPVTGGRNGKLNGHQRDSSALAGDAPVGVGDRG